LAAAILRLAGDPELRRRLAVSARRRTRQRFGEAEVAERVVGQYRRLLAPGQPRPADVVVVRPAGPEDAAAMARLHTAGMPDAFLPTLGQRFLARLYRALVADPQAVALVAEAPAGVVGFAAGVTSVSAFYRRFARSHGPAAALAAAPRLARPSVLRRLLETVRYPAAANGDGGRLPDAELLSIAVAPEFRVGGTGRALVDGVLAGLAQRGADEVKVVVGAANGGANRFYAKVGFHHAGQLTVHTGMPSNVWIRPCHSSSPSPSPSS
jgi:ribosomal protein S18 acetylase RimI-like enzyme